MKSPRHINIPLPLTLATGETFALCGSESSNAVKPAETPAGHSCGIHAELLGCPKVPPSARNQGTEGIQGRDVLQQGGTGRHGEERAIGNREFARLTMTTNLRPAVAAAPNTHQAIDFKGRLSCLSLFAEPAPAGPAGEYQPCGKICGIFLKNRQTKFRI